MNRQQTKIPNGITGLAQRIEELDIGLGLWLEPEMVNKKSDLFSEHPDWLIETPNRRASHRMNQFVLDYSRPEVVEAIYQMMAKILIEVKVSYVKWDMNQSMTQEMLNNEKISKKSNEKKTSVLISHVMIDKYEKVNLFSNMETVEKTRQLQKRKEEME